MDDAQKDTPKRKKTGGRKAAEIDIDKLIECASLGMTVEQCALCQGVTRRTLQLHKEKYPEIQEAFEKGKALGIERMTKALMSRALSDKSDAAIIFYLKAQAGWSDRQVMVMEGGDKPVKVEVEVSDVRAKVMSRLLAQKKAE